MEYLSISLYHFQFPSSVFYSFQHKGLSPPWLSFLLGGTSLVAQWLRIHLPMQGTWVSALVWEDPTCRGTTKPVCHNYWACALEPKSHNCWACVPQLLKPACLEPMLHKREATTMRSPRTATKSSPCESQLEKAHAQQWRPNAAKNKLINFFKKYSS